MNFFAFDRTTWDVWLQNQGVIHTTPQARAQSTKMIFQHVYSEKPFDSEKISKKTFDFVRSQISFEPAVRIVEEHNSLADGSVKFVMECGDGAKVETVLIYERGNRRTVCVSSQVGCSQGCRFCQTGRMGLIRSLTTAEIVSQLVSVQRWLRARPTEKPITNVVFMGMGEPLDNVDAVLQACRIFCDSWAFYLSHHRVTVSTVGLLHGLERVLKESSVSIAFSLHSAVSKERSAIVPSNLRDPLEQVVQRLRIALERKERPTFLIQCTILRGVNDSEKHAQALIECFSGMAVKMNLIPLNEHVGTAYRRPDLDAVYAFAKQLRQAGFVATIRLSKGRDIAAACGQLIA